MKKIILAVSVLVVLGGTLYVLTSLDNSKINRIESVHGFNFTAPEGWYLWEGFSATTNSTHAGYDSASEIVQGENLQEYVNEWKSEDSREFVFTKSDVDVKTRNVNILADYLEVKLENQLEYDDVSISVNDSPIDYGKKEINTDKVESKHIQFLGDKAILNQLKGFGDYKVVILILPHNNSSLTVSKNFGNDVSDDTIINFFEYFLEDLNK